MLRPCTRGAAVIHQRPLFSGHEWTLTKFLCKVIACTQLVTGQHICTDHCGQWSSVVLNWFKCKWVLTVAMCDLFYKPATPPLRLFQCAVFWRRLGFYAVPRGAIHNNAVAVMYSRNIPMAERRIVCFQSKKVKICRFVKFLTTIKYISRDFF